jgi:hypothetical protein
MARRFFASGIATALLLALSILTATEAQAQVYAGPYAPPPGYYAPANGGGAAVAALYPSPRPAPPLVGYTYITYQPLAPHEFLYEHCRTYWREDPCAGPTRTTVKYCHRPSLCECLPNLRWAVPGLHTPPATPSTACNP